MRADAFTTIKVLTIGLILAVLVNLPLYAWIFNKPWDWAMGFPLGWLGVGMNYMATFFHEIGHTVFMWFFGYPTIPMFDFQHGGGLALALTSQQVMILVFVWGCIVFGIWFFRDRPWLQILLGLLLVFNLTFAFSLYHDVFLNFGGPAFESLVAAFLLFRAIYDLAPRGVFERFLNAFFGFGMIIKVYIDGYGLLNSKVWRLVYYEQKGSHGFGDFDKIADMVRFLTFEHVVLLWIALNTACLLMPFLMRLFISPYKEIDI